MIVFVKDRGSRYIEGGESCWEGYIFRFERAFPIPVGVDLSLLIYLGG